MEKFTKEMLEKEFGIELRTQFGRMAKPVSNASFNRFRSFDGITQFRVKEVMTCLGWKQVEVRSVYLSSSDYDYLTQKEKTPDGFYVYGLRDEEGELTEQGITAIANFIKFYGKKFSNSWIEGGQAITEADKLFDRICQRIESVQKKPQHATNTIKPRIYNTQAARGGTGGRLRNK